MSLLDEVSAARSSDAAADALADRVGAAGVGPGKGLRLVAVAMGAGTVLPGILFLTAPAARAEWAVAAMGTLLVVGGAGLTVSRPWGPPLAALGASALALRSLTTGAVPLVLYGSVLALASGALAIRRALLLRTVVSRLDREALRAERLGAARSGPSLLRVAVAVAAVYAVFSVVTFLYHRARGLDAPFGVVVRGADLAALAVRTSFYALTIVAAVLAVRGTTRTLGSWPRRLGDAGRGVLLFLGTFAVLGILGSLLDLAASLRGTGAGAVAQSFQAGVESETARPELGFDVVRFAYAAILAPFGEELLFRWALFRGLRTKMPFVAAALLQAAVFAVLHRYRFAAYQTVLVALASAWAVERTGRILPSVVAHGLWNGLQSLR